LSCFCCLNCDCPDQGQRGAGNLTVTSRYGLGKSRRMLRCRTGKARFSERKGTPLFDVRLPLKKVESVLEHVAEGCGVRQAGRLCRVSPKTPSPATPAWPASTPATPDRPAGPPQGPGSGPTARPDVRDRDQEAREGAIRLLSAVGLRLCRSGRGSVSGTWSELPRSPSVTVPHSVTFTQTGHR
jgi:hypothetical protein